jgi:hypothetical protein
MIPFARWFLYMWSSQVWYERSGLLMLITLFMFAVSMAGIFLGTVVRCLADIAVEWIKTQKGAR